MEITEITSESTGQLKFSKPVNIENVANKPFDIFNIYIKTVTKDIEELLEFKVDSHDKEANTINFTCTFKEPYMLGLLNKKSDMLTFELRNDTANDTAVHLLIINVTGEELASNTTTKRIEMQFDFRNEKMSFFRSMAQTLYFVMIAIILV